MDDDNIYYISDYYKLIELQKKYDENQISEDELSLEEINGLIKLYKKQIKKQLRENKRIIKERKDSNSD